jgi:hypothetical protein
MRLADRLKSWKHFWAAVVTSLLVVVFFGGSLAAALWIALSLKERSAHWTGAGFVLAVIAGAVLGVCVMYAATLLALCVAGGIQSLIQRHRERLK